MSQIDMLKIAPTRDERLFLVLSIFIGIISGLLVVSFRIAINWVQALTLGSAPQPGLLRLIFVPVIMGAVVAALVQLFFPAARGSGVNQTKAALYIYNGYISFKTVIGKFITSALAVGGGFSLGPEDPALQIGAGVASVISRRLGMSRQRLRLFAPVGAAAGLAAAFNAPISAILFVIEEVIGRWSAAVLGSVVLAAISSVVVARRILGIGADVPDSLDHGDGFARAAGLCRAGRDRRVGSEYLFACAGLPAAAPAQSATLDLLCAVAGRGTLCGADRLLRLSAGHGRGL